MLAGAGHFADEEERPGQPWMRVVRSPGRRAVLGAVDAGDGLAADYARTGPPADRSQFQGLAPPGRLFVMDETSGRSARWCADHDYSSSR